MKKCFFFIRLVGIVSLVGLVVVLPQNSLAAEFARPDRPNVVILLADDLGYGELGCQGNPEIPTPHIDSIADSGIRFTAGYVTASYCSPSRAGLLTGRFPTRFGYEFNPVGAHNEEPGCGLPASELTLAQHLRNAGYLAYNAVHSPLQGADAYVQRFGHIENLQRRIFAAMLSNLDDSVGAVLAKLHATNLQKRTLVFFLSDNGGPTRELTSSNLPLRGGKGDVYEGGIRVPFMLQWKGQLPEGQVYDQPVISLDIFATAAVAAGAPLPANQYDGRPRPSNRSIDGVDLMPYLTGKKSGQPHEVLFWRMGQRTAVRVGDWKLVRNPRRGASPWQLYNLADDLAEQNDCALQDADKLAELKRVWEQLNAQMVQPAWQPLMNINRR